MTRTKRISGWVGWIFIVWLAAPFGNYESNEFREVSDSLQFA
jgi:hypothetical protein